MSATGNAGDHVGADGDTHRSRAERAAMDSLAERLAIQFPEMSAEEILNAIRGHYADFDDSPIRDFVPVLVERAVRAEMTDSAIPEQNPRHRA